MTGRYIYLMLTRSTTILSKIIFLATGAQYTHVSLGLDSPSGPFFSFGREYSTFLFPSGFVSESPATGLWARHPETPCCLLRTEVSESAYQSLAAQVSLMELNRKRYHFSVIGIVGCFFHMPISRPRHFFCSEFVSKTLQVAGVLPFRLQPALTRPVDFLSMDDFSIIYQGAISGLVNEEAYCSAKHRCSYQPIM